ncbi:late competence development ComFB family protein [Treponema socranskii]|uniref:late competence development ComFB family protein n=1 Tax=Treponema socranskii TaxID=53419 RepID=UPI003D8C96E5
MKVHNVMEELVMSRVALMYERLNETRPSWLTCDCEDCRIDVVSYVLNRIPPRYVVSGRGIVHTMNIPMPQIKADIDALTMEAIRVINSVKRPYHKDLAPSVHSEESQISFNFPIFSGTVFDGASFEPLIDCTITLKCDEHNADMIDKTWSNPCKTYAPTNGSYSFWVKPFKAEKLGESKYFTFTVEVSANGYTPVSHAFSIPLVSEAEQRNEASTSYSLKIQDLFLFRSDVKNPME